MKRLCFYITLFAIAIQAQSQPLPNNIMFGDSVLSVPQANLAHWLTGTTDGSNLVDRISTTNDPVQIVQRPCVVFDGVADYANSSLTTAELNTSALTVVAHVKPTNSVGKYMGLVTAYTAANTQFGLHKHSTGNNLRFRVGDGSSNQAASMSTAVVDGTAYRAIGIFDAGTIRINVDGIEGIQASIGSVASYGGPILIGDYDATSANFEGQVYEVAIFNRVLTENEITSYNTSGILPTDSLVHHRFEESSGYTVYDVSGNGNHGTIVSPTAGIETVRAGRCDEASWNAMKGCSTLYCNDSEATAGNLSFVNTELLQGAVKDVAFWFRLDAVPTTWRWVAYFDASYYTRSIEVKLTNTRIIQVYSYYSGGQIRLNATHALNVGEWYYIEIHHEAGNNWLKINGTTEDTNVDTHTIANARPTYPFFLLNNQLPTGAVIGSTYGTLTIDGVGTELSSMTDTTDRHELVPALSDGSEDALGNPITNPAGLVHNGGGYSLYFPSGYGISGTNTYAELLSALDTDNLNNIYIYTDDPPSWISAVTNISIYSGGATNLGTD